MDGGEMCQGDDLVANRPRGQQVKQLDHHKLTVRVLVTSSENRTVHELAVPFHTVIGGNTSLPQKIASLQNRQAGRPHHHRRRQGMLILSPQQQHSVQSKRIRFLEPQPKDTMASQTSKPLKGILKKPKKPSPSPSTDSASITPAVKSDPRDPRAIAIHHARLLQERKDIEARIFDNILALLDYPLHPSHPASSPHPEDVAGFVSLVRIFQPSDYDDLIVERNVSENRCGYALCPNPRRKLKGAGTFKLINQGKKNFDIVETKELEKWCSTECTRRALWVKVQLNETAAWERVGLPEIGIDLYPEKDKQTDNTGGQTEKNDRQVKADRETNKLAEVVANLNIEHDRKAASDAAALALERGDNARDKSTRTVEIAIREKAVITTAQAPSLEANATSSDAIEGYKAKFGADANHDDGEETTDWLE